MRRPLSISIAIFLYLILIVTIPFTFSEQKKKERTNFISRSEYSKLNSTAGSLNNIDSVSTLGSFRVTTNNITPPLTSGDDLGIRGSIPPLDWDKSWILGNLNSDIIFEASIPFDPIYMGDTLQYKFVVEKSDGSVEWEGSVGPGGPFGNRVLKLSGGLVELPLVYFDSTAVLPVASNDFIVTSEDSVTEIPVLANDYDPMSDSINITDLTQPTNGTAQIDASNMTVTYLPNAQFNGVDIFSYTITDVIDGSDTAQVSLAVLPNIDPTQVLIYGNNFEGEVGPEWSDSSTDMTPVGQRRFLGQFGNRTVSLTLDTLPEHVSITLSFDLIIIRSWDGNFDDSIRGPDIWELRYDDVGTLLHTTFRNTGLLSTQAYPKSYPGSSFSSRTGSSENMTLGYDFYGDAVYKLNFNFSHTSSSLMLDFSASGLQEISDESWGIDNVEVRVTSCDISISPTSQTFGSSGGTGSVNVTTNGNVCDWTAVSNAEWITITSGDSGGSDGVVNYLVTGNDTNISRTGTLTIAEQTFTVTQSGTSSTRLVRVVDTNASPAGGVSVPIELVAEGDENALGFSLIFDTSILINPQATPGSDAGSATLNTNSSQTNSGRYGIALALPAGQTFATGTREIVVVSFDVDSNALADSTTIGFVDQPIARETVDTNANPLAVDWIEGTVNIFRGYEADVAPRPNGNNNGNVTIADWVQVGRFAAVLDTPRTDVNEFQRADCAPRPCGNGQLRISDWVQAGRYAAGLDSIVAVCGPFSSTFPLAIIGDSNLSGLAEKARSTNTRVVRAAKTTFTSGLSDSLIVELDAQGDENALGFSLMFDPNLLTLMQVLKGGGANNATFIPNVNQADNGLVGIALALPAGETFESETHEIAVVTFTVNSNPSADTISIEFGDQPIPREVVDVNANELQTEWVSATVTIITSIEDLNDEAPSSFELGQNYPNPFNPSTTIEFSMFRPGFVTLKVFDLMGREVAGLAKQKFAAGRYKVAWDASGLESGVYFYQLKVGSYVQTKKLILLK